MDMTIPQILFAGYLLMINLASFICYGVDKRRAIRGEWRIPENVLLLLAAVGGSVGAGAAMLVFRHKIRKRIFFAGIFLIIIFQAMLYFF